MDEPFGALDAETRRIMQEELLGIWRWTGKTVVFVTDDASEAIDLADTISVIGGRLDAAGLRESFATALRG